MKNRTQARKTPRVSNARNPLRYDPTRTLTLRRAFAADLKRKFGRLKGLVVKLLDEEDSFGLKEPVRLINFDPDQPRDAQGRFGSGGYLKALSSLPAKLIDKVKSSAAAKYKSLSDRYGPRYAKAIIGAALLGLPVPLPGASFVTAGPVLAIAEMHRMFLGKPAVATNEGLDEGLVRRAAAEVVEELRREFAGYGTPVANCAVGQLRDATTGRCGPGVGVGIPRNEMPQIRNDDLKEFLQYVYEQGVSVEDSSVPAEDLRPTQKEFRQERVDKIPPEGLANPIIVSRDNYVLDGTHRWVKQWQQHPKTPVKVLRINRPLQQALDLMRGFPKAKFVDNTRWKFTTTPEQVKAFQEWLRTQLDATVTGASDEELWRKYAEAGFRKGVGRAFDDTRAARRAVAVDESQLDFYAGTRDEFLRSAFGRPVAVEKIELLAGRSFDELENVTADMANRMSRELTDGLVEGKGPREIARDLAAAVDIGRDRALVVARTEIVRCHAEGQLDALEALGVTEVGVMVEWSTTGDEKVCDLCDPLEGVVLKIDEARNLLPRHPQCVVGETLVNAPSVVTVMSAEYTGEIVQLTTASGGSISTTVNHIILTQRGWVFARNVTDSDHVVYHARPDGLAVGPDNDQRQPAIGDVFQSLVKSLDESEVTKTLPMPEYLHGDGKSVDSEIKIVLAESVLRRHCHGTEFAESVERFLNLGDVGTFKSQGLNSQGTLSQFLKRAGDAADRLVRRLGVSDILAARSISHHHPIGVGLAANRYAYGPQPAEDCPSVAPVPSGERWQAFPSRVAANEVVNREVNPRLGQGGGDISVLPYPQVDTDLLQPPSHGVDPQSDALGDFLDGLPRRVAFDKVVRIDRTHVKNLLVYDVQTQSSLYTANGYLTSNCRCAWVPAQVGESDKGQVKAASAVRAAVADSVREESPGPEDSTWAGADLNVDSKRPEAVVNEVGVNDLIAYERALNSNPNQPRDDHGRFALHPGVGKLRELFAARGVPHEHLSDLDLHDILSQASAVTAPVESPGKKGKEKPAKESKTAASEAKDVSSHVSRLTALRDNVAAVASDKGQSHDALEAHVTAAAQSVLSIRQ